MLALGIALVLVMDAIDTLAWPRSSGAGATGGVIAVGSVTAAPSFGPLLAPGAPSPGAEPFAETPGSFFCEPLAPVRGAAGVRDPCRPLSRVSRVEPALLLRRDGGGPSPA